MDLEDKFPEELLEFIADIACDDYEHGTPYDSNSIDEFERLLKDQGFNKFTKEDLDELFEYYKEEFTICKERYIMR